MWQHALPVYHAHDGNLFIVIHCGHLKKDANSGSTSLGISKHVSSSSGWAAHLTVKIRRACFGLVQSLRHWTCVLAEQWIPVKPSVLKACLETVLQRRHNFFLNKVGSIRKQQNRRVVEDRFQKKSYRLFQCELFQYALFRILARILRCFWALHHKCNNSTRPVERHLESGLGGTSPPRVALRACKDVISFFSKLFHDIRHKPVQQACHVSLGWVGRRVPSPRGSESNCANQRNQHKVI